MYSFLKDAEAIINEIADSYDKKGSKSFYITNINNFFEDYMGKIENVNRPLNAITYFDINTYLNSLKFSDADKLNHYNALKRFFSYTYSKGITNEIFSQVMRPAYEKPSKKIIDEKHYKILVDFIVDRDNNIKERLLIGLFLFTGLSRKYMSSLRNNHFLFDKGVYYLIVWKDNDEIKLPLKAEMQILVNEYIMNLPNDKQKEKVFDLSENYISTYISELSKKICGKSYTPTTISSTFISKALKNGNYIWEVSRLTLEKVSTIEDYVNDSENLLHKQTAILNSF
jgi:site-specific recombinase XerD